MRNPTMTQCRMTRGETGVLISWIPTEFAQVGRKIDLKEKDFWSRGWIVDKVWTTMDAKAVAERGHDYRIHRRATDV
ncbi:hypothetical protein HOU03_gp540 [Caulobacter phage CcrSC]|uniref:Uncharacterized protein n=2 Tax=Bertelyvirus TaxID=2733152 RepID=A0A385EFX4_9CAUD|nr:hypothetical protein HOU03_gp540 [Caulobacter phage CcrSC]AXQ69727.1 hypothetical protein CcrSC_gp145 [Caulobacter phage CcrSC]